MLSLLLLLHRPLPGLQLLLVAVVSLPRRHLHLLGGVILLKIVLGIEAPLARREGAGPGVEGSGRALFRIRGGIFGKVGIRRKGKGKRARQQDDCDNR